MDKRLFLIPLILVSQPLLALNLPEVQKHYRGIKELKAEIEQTKTSPLLLRPLKAKVGLIYAGEEIRWTVAGQEPWIIRFPASGQAEFVGGGKTLDSLPPDAKAKLNRTISLVKRILVMDPALDKDFRQNWAKDELTIEPKSRDDGASVFFDKVQIRFKPTADIESIRLHTVDDETLLSFQSFSLKR